MNIGLLDRLPEISRARGYRLYSSNGKRIVDFYQEGGRALLGYRVPGVALSMKQALDKGVFPPLKSRYDNRLKNALFSLAGKDIKFSIFSSLESLSLKTGNNIPVFFPSQDTGKNNTAFWHPFSGDTIDSLLSDYAYVIPVIPFPGSFSPQIILGRTSDLPEGDAVSPVLLSPLIRIIYKLIDSADSDPYRIWEKNSIIINKLWTRKGPYLVPLYSREDHEKVFTLFLENGFLVSPDYSIPSILPAEISEGEKSCFLKAAVLLSGGL